MSDEDGKIPRLNKNLLLVALLSLLWGSEWVLNNELAETPRLLGLALRCLVAAVVLLPWAIRGRVAGVAIVRNCILGIAIIAVPALLSTAASNLSPGLAALLFAMIPLIATLFENLGGIAGAAWLIGGITGVAFLVRSSLSFSSSQGLSVLWVGSAVVITAAAIVKARQWLPGQNLAGALCIQMLSAAVTLGLGCGFIERTTGVWTPRAFSFVFLLGVAGSAFSYSILYRLLCYYRASQITVVQWLIPVVAVLETGLAVRHLPSWDSSAGGLLAVICAVMMLRIDPGVQEDVPDGRSPLTLKITLPPGEVLKRSRTGIQG